MAQGPPREDVFDSTEDFDFDDRLNIDFTIQGRQTHPACPRDDFDIDLGDEDLISAESTICAIEYRRRHHAGPSFLNAGTGSKFFELPMEIRQSVREVIMSSNDRKDVSRTFPKYFSDALRPIPDDLTHMPLAAESMKPISRPYRFARDQETPMSEFGNSQPANRSLSDQNKSFAQLIERYVKERRTVIRRFAFTYTLGLPENAASLPRDRYRLPLGDCQHLKARKLHEASVRLNVLTFILQVQAIDLITSQGRLTTPLEQRLKTFLAIFASRKLILIASDPLRIKGS